MNKINNKEVKKDISIILDAFQDTETFDTSLYLHKSRIVLPKGNKHLKVQEIDLNKDPKEDQLVRAMLTKHYGSYLITFINADFSNAENAYNTFFIHYGIEGFDRDDIVRKEYPKAYYSRYSSTKKFLEYYNLLYDIFGEYYQDFQSDMRKTIDFVFNLHENNSCLDLDRYSKFAAFSASCDLIGKLDSDINLALLNEIDNIYGTTSPNLTSKQVEQLAYDISSKKVDTAIRIIYTTSSHFTLAYLALMDLIQNSKRNISVCQNCGRYYLQYSGKETYCDLPNLDGSPSCKTYASRKAYEARVIDDEAEMAYKRDYQRRITQVYRATGDEKRVLKKNYLFWKARAREQLKLYRQGKITKDEFCKWIEENKELKGD